MEKWKHPDSYGGFSPDGDYLVLARSRDSDILSESNWDYACNKLKAVAFDDGRFSNTENESRAAVYHWRAGHWACGWVEYLMIRHDAPSEIIAAGEEISDSLEDYPILDESDFSEREYNHAQEVWKDCLSLKEKIKLCAEEGISIFSARRDYIPEGDSGRIYQLCTE